MGTTTDKLNKLLDTKKNIKQALIDKGVSEVTDIFSSYPDVIKNLRGSLFVMPSGLNFYKYSDATIDLTCFKDADFSLWTSAAYMFNSTNLTTITGLDSLDTSNVTDMSYMFYGSSEFTTLDLNNLNVDNVTNTSYMFGYCTNLVNLDISNWKPQNITNTSYMFLSCTQLTYLDLSQWNLSKVTNINNMFTSCSRLTTLKLGEGWGTNSGTTNLTLSNLAGYSSYKLTDETYNSMLNMYDRAANGLTNTFTITFNSKHNLPTTFKTAMTAKGYTITLI